MSFSYRQRRFTTSDPPDSTVILMSASSSGYDADDRVPSGNRNDVYHEEELIEYAKLDTPQQYEPLPSKRSVHTAYEQALSRESISTHRFQDTPSTVIPLSQKAIPFWHFLADIVFASCLLVSICTRINLLSVYYLLVFCYGVVQSFKSSLLTQLTMLVSLLACIGHVIVVLTVHKNTWKGSLMMRIIGFEPIDSVSLALTHVGVDLLVFISSSIHFFFVLRRFYTREFDFFQASAHLILNKETDVSQQETVVLWMERMCMILLLLTAVSIPSGSTLVYYILFLERSLKWTVYAKRISVYAFHHQMIVGEWCIGFNIARCVLSWSFLIMILWYVLQIPDLSNHMIVHQIMHYAGFVPIKASRWEHVVFLTCQFWLFVSCAKLVNLHQTLTIHRRSEQLSTRFDTQERITPHVLQQELQALPFHMRIFLHQGGSLLASAAAILWCVSYPNYANAGMLAWAFLTVGLFGLVTSLYFIWGLIIYGTCLGVMEYMANFTPLWIPSDTYSKYGLRTFDYPCMDLLIHNIWLSMIYISIRTRWRYHDVLIASQSYMNESPASTTSTMEVVQTHWMHVIPLWIQDAKQVLCTHLDVLVLVTIIGVALSTQVSFVQTGYLVLAVIVILFFKHRYRLWRVLLAYALIACLGVFIRNVDCQPSSQMDLIGLPCYDSTSFTWGSLYPTLFSAQLAIIMQLVFQLVIYVSNQETISKRLETMSESHHYPLFFLSRMAIEIDHCFRLVGSFLCYLLFLFIAFQWERESATGHTTVIGALQLLVCFILLGGHLGTFIQAPRTSLRLKILWLIALMIQVCILVVRYVFQFTTVSTYMKTHVFTSISARDIGLTNHSKSKTLSSVFLYLLPTATIMALCIWQLSSLLQPLRTYDFLAPGRSMWIDRIRFILETLVHVLIAFSTGALLLVTMMTAVQHVNVIGALYVIVLVLGRVFLSWNKLWFPIFWISVFAILTSYLYQLDLFSSHWNSTIQENASWFGLKRLGPMITLWEYEKNVLWILFLCLIQRIGQYLDTKTYDTPMDVVLEARMESETDFISCFKTFCIQYATHASVNIVMLLLMASCFFHHDILSIGYMLIVYMIMSTEAQTVCRHGQWLVIGLSCVILLQYGIILWFPPLMGLERQHVAPWNSLSFSSQQWLGLDPQSKWALMTDFITLLAAYMLPQSRQLWMNQHYSSSIEILPRQQPSFERHSSGGERMESRFIQLTRTSLWYACNYYILISFLPFTLVIVFICGTTSGGIAALIYITTSLYMLFHLQTVRQPCNRWFTILRYWNWIHLFLMTIQTAPFLHSHMIACRSGSIEMDNCLSLSILIGINTNDSIPIGILIIFICLSIHCEMLVSPAYHQVLLYLELEQIRTTQRRMEIIKAHVRERTAQWYCLKRDKNAAVQRLKLIVSKLVHKVEELMDLAMGIHYNLPPMAPCSPRILTCTQNSITIEWDPPMESIHKIRRYLITRQQYPSMTLLGDYADVVEVHGTNTSATITGLRPGTSYQFKIAAVSRMGEGPYSIASEPVSTYPLNLNGCCTAAWMKYRRQDVIQTLWNRMILYFQPFYLLRYVVIDTKQLIYYKNEEMALRHRSRKRLKKIKTCFLWHQVVSFQLRREEREDLSGVFYCFEFLIYQEKDISYRFQVESISDFHRILSTLIEILPYHVFDISVLNYLKEQHLSLPKEQEKSIDEEEDWNEEASEKSSVTYESSFGDVEDEEFDQIHHWAWRLGLYRKLYEWQDAALKLEMTEYDVDDGCEPSIRELLRVFIHVIRSHSAQLCYMVMIMAFTIQADLMNLIYVFAIFGYFIPESPRPSPTAWLGMLYYTCSVVCIKYMFQLSTFCHGLDTSGYFYPSIQPYCQIPSTTEILQIKSIQPIVWIGIYKFDGTILRDGPQTIWHGLRWNFYIALMILWHRTELIFRGLWTRVPSDTSQKMFQTQLSSDKYQRGISDVSSRDSIDETFNDGMTAPRESFDVTLERLQTMSSRGIETMSSRDLDDTRCMSSIQETAQDNENQFAVEVLEELEDEERRVEQEAQTRKESQEENDPLASSHGSQGLSSCQVQLVEQDDTHGSGMSPSKPSWFACYFPRLSAYYQRVITDPPPQWDKNIHIAISGAKPGRDYYAMSLSVLLFASIYAVIFFKQLGEPNSQVNTVGNHPGTTTLTQRPLVSSSMVSGYLVLLVFVELCYVIWDRAAYVCRSLTSKVILQYTYLIFLHVTMWLILPQHTNVYFQQRSVLVFFYLVHCVYLWLGALQIRYGYPVFKASHFNYAEHSIYTRILEKVFPLVMLAPFLFEMRALLDYICTTTSLGWQHWIMLEETAAHLFQVKMEMRERVEKADILQGKRRQPLYRKLSNAGIMLFLLLLCLVGPLALFSSANPSTKSNRITSTEVTLSLEDERGTLNHLYSGSDMNSLDYTGVASVEGASVQRITYDTFSRDVWSTSPPNVKRLIDQLSSNETLSWHLSMTFVRPGPADFKSIDGTYRVPLSTADRAALIQMIQQNTSVTSNREVHLPPIQTRGILPTVVELTATGDVLLRSSTLRSINVTKHSLQGTSWWAVEPSLHAVDSNTGWGDVKYCEDDAPFCVIAVSDNIVDGLSVLGIGSYGITAVYFFVLVTIGSAVQGFFRGALFKIQYNELPYPDDVLELIEGIYIARGERYVGHLRDEVRIFETLVRVLRSPETLSKVTGTNIIHIPQAKEKVD